MPEYENEVWFEKRHSLFDRYHLFFDSWSHVGVCEDDHA